MCNGINRGKGMELMKLLRGLVGHGTIQITADRDVRISKEAKDDICAFLMKQNSSLEARHRLLWECLLTDANGNPLSKTEIDIILTDCVFGLHNMRELLSQYADRLIEEGYQADLIEWYLEKENAKRANA
jgi:hypothetical protein